MITATGLLYIEPASASSNEPCMDELTRKMVAALQQPLLTGILSRKGTFQEGIASRGRHRCRCGAESTNVDYKLSTGEITNALAAHYLAWHRDEIPVGQLELVRNLPKATTGVDINDTKPPAKR